MSRWWPAALALLTLAATPVLGEELLASGRWVEIDYAAAGTWRITRTGEGRLRVAVDEAFETRNGPDLHILLSPRPLAELDNDNAADGALVAGLLVTSDRSLLFKKMRGAQSFLLPAPTRLADYRSILIHCVQYSHLWAGADLGE